MLPGHDAVRETERDWVSVCQPLAVAIDAVLPTNRAAVAVLLEVLRTCCYRRHAQTVLRLARLSSDPLADLDTLVQDALRSWVQLRQLTEAEGWSHPAEVVSTPRSTALFNLALAVAQGRYAPVGLKTSKYEAACERLRAASARESEERRDDVEHRLLVRAHVFPNLFETLDRWLDR